MVMRVVLSDGAFYAGLGLASLLRCGDGFVLLHFQLLLLVLLHVQQKFLVDVPRVFASQSLIISEVEGDEAGVVLEHECEFPNAL